VRAGVSFFMIRRFWKLSFPSLTYLLKPLSIDFRSLLPLILFLPSSETDTFYSSPGRLCLLSRIKPHLTHSFYSPSPSFALPTYSLLPPSVFPPSSALRTVLVFPKSSTPQTSLVSSRCLVKSFFASTSRRFIPCTTTPRLENPQSESPTFFLSLARVRRPSTVERHTFELHKLVDPFFSGSSTRNPVCTACRS